MQSRGLDIVLYLLFLSRIKKIYINIYNSHIGPYSGLLADS